MFSKLYSVLLSCYREEYHTNIYSLDFFQIKVIFSTLYSTELWSCSVQFSLSSCLTLWTTMDGNTPGFPVLHHLPELAQTHAYWVHDAIQLSHPLTSHSPPAFNLSQNQGLFKWVSSLHQVAKLLEFQLQHQSFQWIFRTDFL